MVVALVALVLAGLLAFCLHRRRKNRRSLLNRESVSESEIGRWRGASDARSRVSSDPRYSQDWPERYSRLAAPAPPMAMHPAFNRLGEPTPSSVSEDNPFFTPAERASEMELNHSHAELPENPSPPMSSMGRLSMGDTALGGDERRSTQRRPPTPLVSPLMMSPTRPDENHSMNPFASADDDDDDDDDNFNDEDADFVAPFVPAKSPKRRSSPQVHYPSWSEISEFDFAGERLSRRPLGEEGSMSNSSSSFSAASRPQRSESTLGRHELEGDGGRHHELP